MEKLRQKQTQMATRKDHRIALTRLDRTTWFLRGHAGGDGERKSVGVRIPSSAPLESTTYGDDPISCWDFRLVHCWDICWDSLQQMFPYGDCPRETIENSE